MGVREYPVGPRLYLDMDGVIADFEAYAAQVGEHPQTAKLRPETYQVLKPMEGAISGVELLLNMYRDRVFVLTKIPSKNPHAATQKLIWLKTYLPELHDHAIITPDKGCVGGPRDVLVDDHPEWANASAFPGRIVKFGSGEGAHATTWPELISLLCIKEPLDWK